MNNLNPKNCLLCDGAGYEEIFLYHEPDSYEKAVGLDSQSYARQWGRCTNCDFIYSRYSRPIGLIDKIYETSYRSHGASWRSGSVQEVFERITKLPENESETKFRVQWIKKNIRSFRECGIIKSKEGASRFLDIGGGNGIFAYEFQDKEWKAHVVDPDKNGIFITERFNIPYLQEYYRPNRFPEKFDLISLNYFLEHVLHPRELLKNIHQDIEKGGLLYIEVPDVHCFDAREASDDIFNACHLWMFSPNSLTRLFDLCGFQLFTLNRIMGKRGYVVLTALAGLK